MIELSGDNEIFFFDEQCPTVIKHEY
ncbi:hypothetical protein AB6T47_000263 [Citrobacter braakii]